LASSLAGFDPQYIRAGTWSDPEVNRLPPIGRRAAAQALCLLVPWHLPGRTSERNLVLLSASPDAGAGTVKGSGVQGVEVYGGGRIKCMGETPLPDLSRVDSAFLLELAEYLIANKLSKLLRLRVIDLNPLAC
jgi:hypothetical protein